MRRSMTLLLCLAAACGKPFAESPPPVAAPGMPTVAVVSIVSQTLAKTLRLSGELLAHRDVILHAKVQGYVEKIGVDRGTSVRQGQLLLQMTAPEVAAQRNEAEAKLASDLATYDRLKEASATPGVVSKNDVHIAAQTVEGDRARVKLWQENESYLKVAAPFDGIITERWVHEGSLVTPATALLRLQETATLRLVVAVPEVAAGSLPADGPLTFTVPAYPGVPFSGKVARNAHALDPKTRSMPVELDVDNADGRLAPGMFPELQWPMKRAGPSLFVPPTAVVSTTERNFVIRVKDGAAEWVDVKPGVFTGALQEIFGKIAEGDVVVLRATDELRAGTALKAKEERPLR